MGYNTTNFLNDIDNAKEQQYLMLREAIWKHMEAQRSISMFAITSVLAFYTIILSANMKLSYVFLIPIILLLPFSYKELNHKISISYIAAYQIVCLENNNNVTMAFTWETDFFLFKKKKLDRIPKILFKRMLDSEFLILALLSYFSYLSYFIKYDYNNNDIWCFENLIGYLLGFLFLVLIIMIGQITNEYNLYINSTEYYIKQWLKYMKDMCRVDCDTYKKRYKELIGEEPQENS